MFPCCACGKEKSESSFSKSQLRRERPRCSDCVNAQAPAHRGVSTSRFRRCSRKCWRPTSEFTGTNTLCDACAREKEWRERAREREANRTRARGACRVKEVYQRYGHFCEIPLEAYVEAGVAKSRNDFVTEQDVQAASNTWDAMGIAHDIDTQWGDMPWGGAYSDSNHYWVPDDSEREARAFVLALAAVLDLASETDI